METALKRSLPPEHRPPTATGGVLRARRILSFEPGVEGDAVWWEGGRIRGVGPAATIDREAPPYLPRLDHPESLVTPGFVDGHTHFVMWALGRRRVRPA